MKIAYDHQIFGWQKYGGISRYFFELASNIAASRTADVTVVSPIFVNSYLQSASNGLRVIGGKVPAIRRSGRLFRAANQLLAPALMRNLSPTLFMKPITQKLVAPREKVEWFLRFLT